MKKQLVIGMITAGAMSVGGCALEGELNVEQREQQIIGGDHVTAGRYPWMVQISMRYLNSEGNLTQFSPGCGGALIGKRWVLTAAHCLHSEKTPESPLYDLSNIRVTVGEHHLAVNEGTEVIMPASELIPHEAFGDGAPDVMADIGLIRLAEDVQLNSKVQILRLTSGADYEDNTSYANTNTWVSGWGAMSSMYYDGSAEEPDLKELEALAVAPTQVTPNLGDYYNTCEIFMASPWNVGGYQVRDDAFCTLSLETNVDGIDSACFGDSGGPVIRETPNGCVEQIGIHVTGDTPCVAYNMSTPVALYLDWIHEQVDPVYEAETMTHQTGGSHPDGWNVWDNGYISFNHPSVGGTQEMTIRAAGAFGNGWPHMRVTVNGSDAFHADVTSETWQDYTFSFNAAPGNINVRIYLTNDVYLPNANPPVDRNLYVDKAIVRSLGNDATCQRGATPTDLQATMTVQTTWNNGYCVELHMTNNGSSTINGWNAQINLNGSSFDHGWGIAPTGSGTGLRTFNGVQWGADINPQQTEVVGFCGTRPSGSNFLPTLVSWGLN